MPWVRPRVRVQQVWRAQLEGGIPCALGYRAR